MDFMSCRQSEPVNNCSALLVVDIQKDFCEDGALAVAGGGALAARISSFMEANHTEYALKIATRDWHKPNSNNNGHFSEQPDWTNSWPVHCVASTPGSDYHPNLLVDLFDKHVYKGFGDAAYSAFEGVDERGAGLRDILQGVRQIDIAGIATDYCVHQTAVDSVKSGFVTRVLVDLCLGIDSQRSSGLIDELRALGAQIINSTYI